MLGVARRSSLRLLQDRGRRPREYAEPGFLDPVPHPLDFIWLELTGRCNLECVHCYAESSKLAEDHLKTDDWTAILVDGFRAGCKGVQFIGGEPTLFEDLVQLIVKSRDLGYEYVELYTNATQLTDTLLNEMEAHSVQVAASFYSPSPETHDAITRAAGSFAGTVDGIRRIVERGIPLRVGIIRLPENATHLEAAKDFLVGLGVARDKVLVDRVRGHGRGALIVNEHNEYSGLCGHCGDGRLAVASDGSVYPCIHAREFRLGNALLDSLGEIAGSSRLVEFRREMLANLDENVKKALHEDPHSPRGL
jgi:MoaA/NifB/PqqE/SkfB family radical SAM enzyme